jgi:hypothetical protein
LIALAPVLLNCRFYGRVKELGAFNNVEKLPGTENTLYLEFPDIEIFPGIWRECNRSSF